MAIFDLDLTFIGWEPEIDEETHSAKEQCLKKMVNLIVEKGFTNDEEGVFQSLISREKDMSTGIGNMIAIPHVRHKSISQFKAIIYLLDKGIDFNSVDGREVRLVLFFAIPEQEGGKYMRLLSKIAEFLKSEDNRSRILSCKNKEELYISFRSLEDEK